VGNARTFLVAWLRARQAGGALLLRVEDLDHPKVKHGVTEAMLGDLRWLGIDWDEGPGAEGRHAPYVQSHRTGLYTAALARLAAAGLVYPCACSRRDIAEAASAPHGLDGPLYPGTCRERFPSWAAAEAARGQAAAIRFRTPRLAHVRFEDAFSGELHAPAAQIGDFVVARHGGAFAYQLAVVVDDARMGVTEVVRADDLLPSTPRQVLLYRALGQTPPAFVHVPLVVGPDGRRLAKRHGDTRIAHIRDAGAPPQRMVAWLARSLGMEVGEEATASELIQRFDLARIPREPCILDPRELARFLGVPARSLTG
jgi:glutamyl-tRNA synthetase